MEKPSTTIPPSISEYGWYLFEICRCGGILTYKFRHQAKPGLQINWRVKYYDFKVFNGNSTRVALTKIARLEEVLKEL